MSKKPQKNCGKFCKKSLTKQIEVSIIQNIKGKGVFKRNLEDAFAIFLFIRLSKGEEGNAKGHRNFRKQSI